MLRQLPYPGYSWSFTQHIGRVNAETVHLMMQCAQPFEGRSKDCGDEITALMVQYDILTDNRRDGKDSAWRDYQQILAELGLIYSTRISGTIKLTELGHMFVAGEIGYTELMGTQALRYQYPNGQKHTISGGLRQTLTSTTQANVENLIELQTSHGVLIKPGLLILRILLELEHLGDNPVLSVYECWKFLVPSRTNAEWPDCIAEIAGFRRSAGFENAIPDVPRRHLQEWFRLLGQSDLFKLTDGKIKLSEKARQDTVGLVYICTIEEDVASFWIPSDSSRSSQVAWFDQFGHLPLQSQNLLQNEYLDDETDSSTPFTPALCGIDLTPIDFSALGIASSFNFNGDLEQLANAMAEGAQKRHAKAILHDQIVKDLAERLQSQGAVVSSGQSSIDLFADWGNGVSAIFEVKTVTKRSLQSRIRSAIGQLHEYQYRRTLGGNGPSDLVIAINAELPEASWQSGFVSEHMRMGLLCRTETGFKGTGGANLLSRNQWTNL